MNPIDDYLLDVRRHLFGMDTHTKNDIIEELKSHILDAAKEYDGDVEKAISTMSSAREVAKMYKEVYGYGAGFRALFILLGGVISIPSAPILLPGSTAIEGPIWISIFFFALVAFYLIWISIVAGRAVGLYSGISACLARFVVLGAILMTSPEAVIGSPLGILSFILSSLFLVAIGYLPGQAKARWKVGSPIL